MAFKRVLEPEVMDSMEEAVAYDAMDHARVNSRFVDDLLAAGPIAGDVLDLGTGTAQIPIELCQRTDGLGVVGIDLSESMLQVGRSNIDAVGLSDRIRLELADAKTLPYADHQFSCVISNSIVHHIPDPVATLAEAVRVTAPGGLIFFRDLMRPADQDQLDQLVMLYAMGECPEARKMFADSLRAALTLNEMQDVVQSLGYSWELVQATSDRHWTWCARRA
ncbi:MAG: class I SAM-dependent methyltransferase [Planctomycetales bacterium]|nr:class I SAM-dependent methyltransferase [Planctomycetales bacterium]